MFQLQPNPTFKHPVEIPIPGSEIMGIVEFEFRHQTKKALQEWAKSANADTLDVDYLALVIVGWENMSEPYSRESLEALLDNYLGAGRAIFNGYLAGLSGGRQKN